KEEVNFDINITIAQAVLIYNISATPNIVWPMQYNFKKGENRMGKSRFTKALFALMLVLLLALAACSDKDNKNDAKEPNNNTNSEQQDNADNEDEVDDDLYSIEDFSTDKT